MARPRAPSTPLRGPGERPPAPRKSPRKGGQTRGSGYRPRRRPPLPARPHVGARPGWCGPPPPRRRGPGPWPPLRGTARETPRRPETRGPILGRPPALPARGRKSFCRSPAAPPGPVLAGGSGGFSSRGAPGPGAGAAAKKSRGWETRRPAARANPKSSERPLPQSIAHVGAVFGRDPPRSERRPPPGAGPTSPRTVCGTAPGWLPGRRGWGPDRRDGGVDVLPDGRSPAPPNARRTLPWFEKTARGQPCSWRARSRGRLRGRRSPIFGREPAPGPRAAADHEGAV